MDNPAQDQAQATDNQPQAGDDAAQSRTFTQEEVNRLMAERLNRQKSQLEQQFADYNELKKFKDDYEAQNQTEQEKLAAQLKAFETQAQEAERKAQEAEARYVSERVRNDFIAKAAKDDIKARDPEALYVLAQANDLVGKFEDGKITDHNFQQLKTNYPYLFATGPGGQGDGGAGQNAPPAPATDPGIPTLRAGYDQSARRSA